MALNTTTLGSAFQAFVITVTIFLEAVTFLTGTAPISCAESHLPHPVCAVLMILAKFTSAHDSTVNSFGQAFTVQF